ncbi:hypothetical protein B0J13DRAFT_552983 [Dactylonectria estremocensis]|uniref:Uncharacterized protein n=1 Tax=Dactylonectria estremocensis TaxID=1079267 RepID=A0A9P9J741_9HYPO|nr:hypothetical protein B0J13DRAFT_552983 [Dactylonectria estremocensis]
MAHRSPYGGAELDSRLSVYNNTIPYLNRCRGRMSNFLIQLENSSLASWNFSRNCTSTAYYVQQSLENTYGAGLSTVIDFLSSSLPALLYGKAAANDEKSALIAWFLDTKIPQEMLDHASRVCQVQLCPILQWEGEPDAAGIGVNNVFTLYSGYRYVTIHSFFSH